jgi:hypothetical protein
MELTGLGTVVIIFRETETVYSRLLKNESYEEEIGQMSQWKENRERRLKEMRIRNV